MAKAKFFEKRALDSRLTSPDVTAKEKWLGYLLGPSGALLLNRARDLPQCLLYRCPKPHHRVGRRVPRGVPDSVEDNRRYNKYSHGLYHRPHAHKTGQGAPLAAALRAACRCDRHIALHSPLG